MLMTLAVGASAAAQSQRTASKQHRQAIESHGDTIVYHAGAYQLATGATLAELISQLPGSELRQESQIYLNDRRVEELTLNGKAFFGNYMVALLHQLPCDLVEKLVVYNKSTEHSRWLANQIDNRYYAMDVVLKGQYVRGLTVAVEGGIAPFASESEKKSEFADLPMSKDDEALYRARLFAQRFTANTRMTLLGNVDNLTRLSSVDGEDESMYNGMDNGRNRNAKVGAEMTLADGSKKWQESLSALFDWNRGDVQSMSSYEQYLGSGNTIFGRSKAALDGKDFNLKAFNRFKMVDLFPGWHIHFNLDFSYSRQKADLLYRHFLSDHHPSEWGNNQLMFDSIIAGYLNPGLRRMLVNRSLLQGRQDSSGLNASTDIGIWHKTALGDVGVNFVGSVERKKELTYMRQLADFPMFDEEGYDPVSQHRYSPKDPQKACDFAVVPFYNFNLHGGFVLKTNYAYRHFYQSNTNESYLLEKLSSYKMQYGEIDALPSNRDSLMMAFDANNSNRQTMRRNLHELTAALRYNKESRWKRLSCMLSVSMQSESDKLHHSSELLDTLLRQQRAMSGTDLAVEYYQIARGDSLFSHQLRFRYTMEEVLPSLTHQVEVRNDEDPLNIRLGNPDLKSTLTHLFDFRLSRSRSRHWCRQELWGNVVIGRNKISQGYTYDPSTGVNIHRPVNVNGNWGSELGLVFQGDMDKSSRFSYGSNTTGKFQRNVDYAAVSEGASSELSHVNNWIIAQRLEMGCRFGGNRIRLLGSLNYRYANQKESRIADVKTLNFAYGLDAHACLPLKIWLNTSLMMSSRRGYGDSSLNRNDLIWNASLHYQLLKERLTFKLEVYDLLRQMSNVMAVVDGQGRTETIYNTLPRYAMLHAILRL